MILIWGERSDPPVARVLDALHARGVGTCVLDHTALDTARYKLEFAARPSGWIELTGRRISVTDIDGAYVRPGQPRTAGARAAAAALMSLVSSLPGTVVNRPGAGRSNASKPYQLGLLERAGFEVPDTLLTTDPRAARAFLRKHGCVVYKSLSGIRSIVATLSADRPSDMSRLDAVRTGPVQLQRYVSGLDVRVHVVGEEWFACSARSEATDYRYAALTDHSVELAEYELPTGMGERLIALVHQLSLEVGGVDLRRRADGSWVCFEVNPSPGFPWYEDATGHPIAESIADLLVSGRRNC